MEQKQALKGIRVADFGWVGAGPLTTRTLAHEGAEVIKIESTNRIDGMRQTSFRKDEHGEPIRGDWFTSLNSGKKAITLNMSRPEAREIAKRLIAVSDLVVDNFTPYVMDKWGFSYSELKKIKPDIIVLRMPVMGLDGPHSHFSAYGHSITGAAGINLMMGFPDRLPVGPGIGYPDFHPQPCHAVSAILAALIYRNRTGKGQFIELAQYESTINVIGPATLDYVANGHLPERMGNRHPYTAPHGAYRCKGADSWCVIAAFGDSQWQALCEVMGRDDLPHDERFCTLPARLNNQDDLDRLIEAWTRERTAEEVMTRLQERGVPAGVVADTPYLVDRDPQLEARQHYVLVDHPVNGPMKQDRPPYRFSETPSVVKRAPLFGEHNDYVYQEILGLSEEEVNLYLVDGVLS